MGESSINFNKETIRYGVISLIILGYGFTPFLNKDLNSFFEALVGCYFFYLFVVNENNFRKDKMVKIFTLIIFSQIATWLSVRLSHPELAYSLPKIDRLGKLFLFIPISWHLSRYRNQVPFFLLTVLIGFFLAVFFEDNIFSQIKQGMNGYRLDFGIRNAQHPSMIFGVILLFSTISTFFISNKLLKFFCFPCLILISFFGLCFTQTRQSFVALAVAFCIVGIVFCFFRIIELRKIVFFLVVICSLLTVLIKFGHLNKRFQAVNSFFDSVKNVKIENGNTLNLEEKISVFIKKIPNTGAGIRVKTWLNAVPWIVEKPLLGWGSEARSFTIKKSTILPESISKYFGHLHNFHIEMVLSYGIVGILILYSMYIWLFWSAFKVWNTSKNSTFIFILAIAFLGYWLTINNFESMNSFWTGVFVNNAICGFIYSNYLYQNRMLSFK